MVKLDMRRLGFASALLAGCMALMAWPAAGAGPAWAAGPSAGATAAGAPKVRVPVLMYHHIGNPVGPASENQFYVSQAVFDTQMAYLANNGFNSVSLEQVLAALQGEAALPPQPVAVTFDDSNQDNFDLALPVLEKYHLSATFLIVTGWVGRPGRLTWREIADMQRAGMYFGAHTVTHPYLPTLSLAAADREIRDSKADLEAHLGQAVRVFAYPYGRTDIPVTHLVQTAGFGLALGTSPYRAEHTRAERFYLTRFGVYSWTNLHSFQSHLPIVPAFNSSISEHGQVFQPPWSLWFYP